jgi:hypothetical protein
MWHKELHRENTGMLCAEGSSSYPNIILPPWHLTYLQSCYTEPEKDMNGMRDISTQCIFKGQFLACPGRPSVDRYIGPVSECHTNPKFPCSLPAARQQDMLSHTGPKKRCGTVSLLSLICIDLHPHRCLALTFDLGMESPVCKSTIREA